MDHLQVALIALISVFAAHILFFIIGSLTAVYKVKKLPEYNNKTPTIAEQKRFVQLFKDIIDQEMYVQFHATFLKLKLDDIAKDIFEEQKKQKPEK